MNNEKNLNNKYKRGQIIFLNQNHNRLITHLIKSINPLLTIVLPPIVFIWNQNRVSVQFGLETDHTRHTREHCEFHLSLHLFLWWANHNVCLFCFIFSSFTYYLINNMQYDTNLNNMILLISNSHNDMNNNIIIIIIRG